MNIEHQNRSNNITVDETKDTSFSDDYYSTYPGFSYHNKETKSTMNNNEKLFHEQCNESIFIVKISTPDEIILDSFNAAINITSKGIQQSNGAYIVSCRVYDGINGSGLEPLWIALNFDLELDVRLRYLHYQLGNLLNYSYDDRTLQVYDNESLYSGFMQYPWSSKIPPGVWYFVFSGVIPDVEQSDLLPKWEVWLNISGNCSNVSISTGEGGSVYGLWYGEYDANLVISKSAALELMVNGKKSFEVNNTFFYWYESFPFWRGYFRIKWVTPVDTRYFTMLVVRGRLLYNEDAVVGCFWGMGGSGQYELVLNYMDYGRTIWGFGFAMYPLFIGLDVELP